MTPAVCIVPEADLTERQQRVLELLAAREAGDYLTLRQVGRILGDESSNALHATLHALHRKGVIRRADPPLHWRVRWIHKPAVYVRLGRRDGWFFHRPATGTLYQ